MSRFYSSVPLIHLGRYYYTKHPWCWIKVAVREKFLDEMLERNPSWSKELKDLSPKRYWAWKEKQDKLKEQEHTKNTSKNQPSSPDNSYELD